MDGSLRHLLQFGHPAADIGLVSVVMLSLTRCAWLVNWLLRLLERVEDGVTQAHLGSKSTNQTNSV